MLLVVEAVAVAAAGVFAVVCWTRGVTVAEFAPIAAGGQPFTATQYSGTWLTASFASALVAGLLALDLRRRRAASGED